MAITGCLIIFISMSRYYKYISVVIPSWRRHEEVMRAVRSALAQTLSPLEVIVANDGPDAEKCALLAGVDDERVRYLEAPRKGIASATRNFGIQAARGDWVALLDDDDVWMPEKLKNQFEALGQSGRSDAILACVQRVCDVDERVQFRPKRTREGALSVDEVLFTGLGGVHTSTLVAPRAVFLEFPFNEAAERHEDWEWLLQAGQKLPLVIAPEVVCERWLAPGEGLSRAGGYEYSRAWYERNRSMMSPAMRARFVSTVLSRKAAYDRKVSAIPALFREMWHSGAPELKNFGRLCLPWVVPAGLRQRLRQVLTGKRS